MTIKEHLEWQLGVANEETDRKLIKSIIKDLEVLEMLRPHLVNAGIGMFDNVEDNDIFHLKLNLSGKEYKQIEEWLNGQGQV